jgi:HlyD family secretion protein
MISPRDASDLHVGQKAEIRFETIHDRTLPVFEGEITRLSADSFVDEKTGARYYTGEVTVPHEVLARADKAEGGLARLKPGLPAQVVVRLRERTLLQYLVEPISQSLWRSGGEH